MNEHVPAAPGVAAAPSTGVAMVAAGKGAYYMASLLPLYLFILSYLHIFSYIYTHLNL